MKSFPSVNLFGGYVHLSAILSCFGLGCKKVLSATDSHHVEWSPKMIQFNHAQLVRYKRVFIIARNRDELRDWNLLKETLPPRFIVYYYSQDGKPITTLEFADKLLYTLPLPKVRQFLKRGIKLKGVLGYRQKDFAELFKKIHTFNGLLPIKILDTIFHNPEPEKTHKKLFEDDGGEQFIPAIHSTTLGYMTTPAWAQIYISCLETESAWAFHFQNERIEKLLNINLVAMSCYFTALDHATLFNDLSRLSSKDPIKIIEEIQTRSQYSLRSLICVNDTSELARWDQLRVTLRMPKSICFFVRFNIGPVTTPGFLANLKATFLPPKWPM